MTAAPEQQPPPPTNRAGRSRTWPVLGAALAAVLMLFLVLPTVALLITASPGRLLAGLGDRMVLPALALSLLTTGCALVVVLVCGTPLAWWLGRSESRLGRWAHTAVQLPAVIPPAVAGIALLLTFGRRGLVGAWLDQHGLGVAFSGAAVVMAQIFVSAPFYVQPAAVAFGRLDASMLAAARSLGAAPARVFFRVALPLARPGLLAGAAMCWARALGEFGATLMFAGNMEGKTQTLPLAIYAALESDVRTAQALSVILVIVAFGVLLIMRRAQNRRDVAPM